MSTVAAIFNSRAEAENGVSRLLESGVEDERISYLTPGSTHGELDEEVRTTETEGSGTGTAIGGAVGGAIGAAGGLPLGAAVASLFVPGVGPILAAGIVGAALLGAGGAAAGAAAGGALEDSIASGLPHDELFIYEDALRRGRTVLIVATKDDEDAERVGAILESAGAESLNAARDNWWLGLRDVEEAEYTVDGGDFNDDESSFRRGFEASLHPSSRGRSYEDDSSRLRECFGDECDSQPFRRGYARGQEYHRRIVEGRAS